MSNRDKPIYINAETHRRLKVVVFNKELKSLKELSNAICIYCLDNEELMKEIIENLKK